MPACPRCSSAMNLKRSAKGAFWGCTKYPACRGTVDAPGQQVAVNGARIAAKFGGRCSSCGSEFETGDPIVYSDRRVTGCPACAPAATTHARKAEPAMPKVEVPFVDGWKALVESDTPPGQAPYLLPDPPEYLEQIPSCTLQLDKHQQAVVNWRKGEALVAACAGSGKSTCLIERTAGLIKEGAIPETVLTLVYNKDAATLLRQRLKDRIGPAFSSRVPAFTFHGFCYALLQEWYPGKFGRGKIVGVDDGPSSFMLALEAAKAADCNDDRFDVKGMIKVSELARESLIDLEGASVAGQLITLPIDLDMNTATTAAKFIRAYQMEKTRRGVIDFADMIWLVCRALDHGGSRVDALAKRYQHVQVDECQDAAPSRLKIATFFKPHVKSLLMVGDLRQSIYKFSGAVPENVHKRVLEGHAKLLPLPVNRRSTETIVEAGNAISRGHVWNLGGDCTQAPSALKKDAAEPLRIWFTADAHEEAEAIAHEIQARVADSELVLKEVVCCEDCKSEWETRYEKEASESKATVEVVQHTVADRRSRTTNGMQSHNSGPRIEEAGAASKASSADCRSVGGVDRRGAQLVEAREDEEANNAPSVKATPQCHSCKQVSAYTIKIKRNYRLEDFCCLVRTNAQAASLECAFMVQKLPCRVKGATGGVWDTTIGKEIRAYLAAAEDKGTDDTKLIGNKPKRYLRRDIVSAAAAASKDGGLVAALEATGNRGAMSLAADLRFIQRQDWAGRCKEVERLLLKAVTEIAVDDSIGTPDEDKEAAVKLMISSAIALGSLEAIEAQRAAMKKLKATAPAVEISTVHKCVAGDTWIETPEGLLPIQEVKEEGATATPNGVQRYIQKFVLGEMPARKIETEGGYKLTATLQHGITCWRDGVWKRLETQELREGDYLRVRLGAVCDVRKEPQLPLAPVDMDVRTRIYQVPRKLSVEAAEFLGLMCADGTLFHSGFRLVKRYQSVTTRFAQLTRALFAVPVKEEPANNSENAFSAEVHSVFLSAWLNQIDGVQPNAKNVPDVILRAPLTHQAAFLRGLFEDGTVNEDGKHVDHIHWETKFESMAEKVQRLLLRFGIISSLKSRIENGWDGFSLYIYGQNAKRFADRIGFVAAEKNKRLENRTFSHETHYRIPLSRVEVDSMRRWITKNDLWNARARGFISRAIAQKVLDRTDVTNDVRTLLEDCLQWHYPQVETLTSTSCDAFCLEVPQGSRFLQNGFDGWNSKGLEWPVVFTCGLSEGTFPHRKAKDQEEELRLFYVAVTRAKLAAILSTGGLKAEVDENGVEGEELHDLPLGASPFLEPLLPLAEVTTGPSAHDQEEDPIAGDRDPDHPDPAHERC